LYAAVFLQPYGCSKLVMTAVQPPNQRKPKNALNLVEQVSKILANFGGESTS
jgi:hypothetical protein